MKNSKQLKELSDKIDEIKKQYVFIYSDFCQYLKYDKDKALFSEIIEKAEAWDIFKAKCSKGAKVACSNLSKKERIERARQAGCANAKRIEKEKQRKRQNQINKHRI